MALKECVDIGIDRPGLLRLPRSGCSVLFERRLNRLVYTKNVAEAILALKDYRGSQWCAPGPNKEELFFVVEK